MDYNENETQKINITDEKAENEEPKRKRSAKKSSNKSAVWYPCLLVDDMELLPNTAASFQTSENFNIKAIERAADMNTEIILLLKQEGAIKPVGVKCRLSNIVRMDKSSVSVLLEGIGKVGVTDIEELPEITLGRVIELYDKEDCTPEETESYKRMLLESVEYISKATGARPRQHILDMIKRTDSLVEAIYISMMMLKDSGNNKYDVLQETCASEKMRRIKTLIEEEKLFIEVMNEIDGTVQEKLKAQNKEYILREQRNAINAELGEGGSDEDYDELKQAIEALNASDEVKEKLRKEMARLERMPETAPESAIIRSYIEWAAELPWDNVSKDEEDIDKVIKVLDEDHYGIKDVKERVAEYLAVRMLSKGKMAAGTSLCLVGPPGVGKTTVAKSIARALNKDFAQLTLGGVHDEATIRGHRRTYIGAMPGNILSALGRCKSNNPVFLLDEADKITRDMRGDPQAALLEVLDPNQNKEFRDNYLDMPYNLSDVMFIVTANDIGTIDKPLLDRLEVIHMDGYMPDEKLNIAKEYLIKKQARLNGLQEDSVVFSDRAILEIIDGYTRESGVRELERKIAAIMRKIAFEYVRTKSASVTYVDEADIERYLKARVFRAAKSKDGAVGRVTGLAWNGYGGATLDIEAVTFGGKGEIKLTGNLGDIMKESAHIAASVVRQRSSNISLKEDYFNTHDIHIHVPEGAVPKDGPSAGITLSTAVLSAVTGWHAADNLAMTGEVSLTGRVLPIGGLKEKSLAADRVGISRIIIPKDNLKDMDELQDSLKERIEFIPVANIDEVFRVAFREYAG